MKRIQLCEINASARMLTFAATATIFAVGSLVPAHEGEDHKKDKHAEHKAGDAHADHAAADPYPLDTCIVSGEKLGEMGEPIVKVYDGREIKFCCAGCPKKFEADKAAYLKKLDEAIIAQQKASFPSEVCLVSGDKFGGDMGDPVDYVFGNRYMKLCCKGCAKDLMKDPAKFLPKMDAAIIARDMKSYPLDTCVVSGDKLGSMGKPVDFVFAGRLVRLCCEKHRAAFDKEPWKFMRKLDAAANGDGHQGHNH